MAKVGTISEDSPHIHTVGEVLEVILGTAEIWLDDERSAVTANHSVLTPAGAIRGFRNTGPDTLHVRATLAVSIFEAQYASSKKANRR